MGKVKYIPVNAILGKLLCCNFYAENTVQRLWRLMMAYISERPCSSLLNVIQNWILNLSPSCLMIRKHFFTGCQALNWLPREMVESPSLGVFNRHVNVAPGDMA